MGEAEKKKKKKKNFFDATAVGCLLSFMKHFIWTNQGRKQLVLADTFKLEFRVKKEMIMIREIDMIANVGS